MNNGNNCIFCQEIDTHTKNMSSKSRIVMETTHFVVFPTIGCFQLGYLLIVPKQHYLCFGELDDTQINELEEIIEKILEYVDKRLGLKCVVFEHGTRNLTQTTATSIIHAHLHVVPFASALINHIPKRYKTKRIGNMKDLSYESDNYLYIRDTCGNNFIVEGDKLPSQFFRKILCKAIGKPYYWNWKRYKYIRNMNATIEFYSDLR